MFEIAAKAVHHQRNHNERQERRTYVQRWRPARWNASQVREPERETDREHEARHDRVGIAEESVVVLQHLVNRNEPARKLTTNIPATV